MADFPHFALPFRFSNGAAVVLEQDTTDEILSCVLAVILCPLGYRVELPTFGTPDLAFAEGVARADVIDTVVNEWEPRAAQASSAWLDDVDELISHVLVRFGAPSED